MAMDGRGDPREGRTPSVGAGLSVPAEQDTTLAGQNTVGTENYEHYQRRHQLADFERTWRGQGIQPGQEAPDFELESTTGERIRLSALRGRPVLLHFGSLT